MVSWHGGSVHYQHQVDLVVFFDKSDMIVQASKKFKVKSLKIFSYEK